MMIFLKFYYLFFLVVVVEILLSTSCSNHELGECHQEDVFFHSPPELLEYTYPSFYGPYDTWWKGVWSYYIVPNEPGQNASAMCFFYSLRHALLYYNKDYTPYNLALLYKEYKNMNDSTFYSTILYNGLPITDMTGFMNYLTFPYGILGGIIHTYIETADSDLAVKNYINSSYPLIAIMPISSTTGHAVTIVAYQSDNSNHVLYYEPASGSVEHGGYSTLFQGTIPVY